MSDWTIRRPGQACSGCDRGFEPAEAHYSLLVFREGRIEREDLCPMCFDGRGPAGTSPEARRGPVDPGGRAGRAREELVWWRTRRPEEGRRTLQVDFDAVEALFGALAGRREERLIELRHLLALLLLRKRRLKLVGIGRGEPSGEGAAQEEVLFVRRPRRDERLAVSVRELSSERAAELAAELERIFSGADPDEVLAAPPGATEPPAALPASDGFERGPQDDDPSDGNDPAPRGDRAPGAAARP